MIWQSYLSEMENWNGLSIDPKGFGALKVSTPVTPRNYIEFAEKDLLISGTHGCVNAVSNSKRAIDCQLTNILFALGLSKAGNLQSKLSRIGDLGLIAPRILKKVNKSRNLLENEFQDPLLEEAENAVDIAVLFIEATDKIFIDFMDTFWIAKEDSANRWSPQMIADQILKEDLSKVLPTFSDGLYVEYDPARADYGVSAYKGSKVVFEAEIKKGSQLHIEMIKISLINHLTKLDFDYEISRVDFLNRIKDKAGISILDAAEKIE